jgi:NAD(P)-dependent dehydrogenase (short-subunit alcohol dehydrogenase family)
MLWEKRRWNGSQAYGETKFHDVLLAFAVARLFPGVKSNALEPGWVPTRMGGAGAPDDLDKGHRTQVWLATSDEPAAIVSGQYFFHQKLRDPDPATKDVDRQGFCSTCVTRFQGRRFPNCSLFRIPQRTRVTFVPR